MAHGEGAHTDEGEGVGKVAQQHFKKLEKALDHKHGLAAGSGRFGLFLQKGGEGLLKEHEEQGQAEHNGKHRRGGHGVSAHEQHHGNHYATVEHQPRGPVCVKPDLFHVFFPDAVDHV